MSVTKNLDERHEDDTNLISIIEAALFSANEPIGVKKIQALFPEDARPEAAEIRASLDEIKQQYVSRGVELVRIGKGWRFQSKESLSPWLRKLEVVKPPKYSRASLETLAIIAYRQPVTRGDIEEVRGIKVSSDIIKTLEERGWIMVIGHREVPGHPELLATTSEFLSHFNLQRLQDLPELIDARTLGQIAQDMDVSWPVSESENTNNNVKDSSMGGAELDDSGLGENKQQPKAKVIDFQGSTIEEEQESPIEDESE